MSELPVSGLDDFRKRLIAHALKMVELAPLVKSEASTNISLVQPFLSVLGYDPANPAQVAPEHHADYADKYPNKVDYAIMDGTIPVIALESKVVNTQLKEHAGQLRSYFHACTSVKLGILTDGLKYEFYADSDTPNIMDEVAFLRFDFSKIAKDGNIDDNTLSGIAAIRNGSFNPDDVGAEARKKMLFESIVKALKQFKSEPSSDFVRFILGCTPIGNKFGKITQKIIDANTDLVRAALEGFVAQEALARFGYAPKDVVRTPASDPVVTTVAAIEPDGVTLLPTDAENNVLNFARNRLLYLVRNEVLFGEVLKITHRKSKTSFRVFYGTPNSGSLFDFRQQKDGTFQLQFPALDGAEFPYTVSPALDEALLKVFTSRVTKAGVQFETTTILRSIQGGQASA